MIVALDLAGNFSAGDAIVSGLIAAVAMLAVVYGGKAMGMTTMDLLKMLGTMVSPKAEGTTAYGIGLMVHLMMGAGFALIDAGLLHAFDPTSSGSAAGLGLLFGAIHGMVVTVMMPAMLKMAHPLVKSGEMDDPGQFMTGMGKMTPIGMVMAHVVFGLVAGAYYASAIG